MHEPHRLYFITSRTIHGRLLMRPEPYVNDLIGGIVGRAADHFNVELHGLVAASNHIHLIASAEEPQTISAFMQYVLSLIARKLGPHVDWRDKMWARRYSAEPILDDEAAIGRLRYIFAHGAKEALTFRSEMWPGLTCIPEVVHGVRRVFPWLDWTERSRSIERGEHRPDSDFITYYLIQNGRTNTCWAQGLVRDNATNNVLVCMVTGENAEYMDSLGEQGMVSQVLGDLDDMFGGNKASSAFAAAHVQNWGADPYVRGCYSYPALGTYPDGGTPMADILAEPVNGRLFFGGEATSKYHKATLQGALGGGATAAEQIISNNR